MAELTLSDGRVAIVDDADFERLSGYRWYPHRSQRGEQVTCYAKRSLKIGGRWRSVYLHREILGAGPKEEVDHINGDGLDCRRSNLRPATPTQNHANRRRRSYSSAPFKGIYFHKLKKRWFAEAKRHGRKERSGGFHTADEAAAAYDELARRLHGEFARLNFPRQGERGA